MESKQIMDRLVNAYAADNSSLWEQLIVAMSAINEVKAPILRDHRAIAEALAVETLHWALAVETLHWALAVETLHWALAVETLHWEHGDGVQ